MGQYAALFGAATSVANSITGPINQLGNLSAQREIAQKNIQVNQMLTELLIEDAIFRGEEAVRVVQDRSKVLIGRQRAAFAGQGVDVNVGSPAEVTLDTVKTAARDTATIRNNVWREVFGFKLKGASLTGQANQLAIASGSLETSAIAGSVFGGIATGVSTFDNLSGFFDLGTEVTSGDTTATSEIGTGGTEVPRSLTQSPFRQFF